MSSTKKQEILDKWISFFQETDIEVELISKRDIMDAFNTKDILLFTDEDEIRGLRALYQDILDKDFKWEQALTLEDLDEELGEALVEDYGEAVLRNIKDSGVHVIELQIIQNESDYWKNVRKEIKLKFEKIGAEVSTIIYKEFWEDFYDEKYDEDYASEVATQIYPQIVVDGILKLKDIQGKYCNVSNGERRTVGQPEKYNNTVYFFGPCFVVGYRVEDADTMASRLQEIFNANDIASRVVNCGCITNELQLLTKICFTDFKRGDVAIVYNRNRDYTAIPTINLAETLERNQVPARWYLDNPIHPNHKVLKLWAKEIYKFLSKDVLTNKTAEEIEKSNEKHSPMIQLYLERYFVDFKVQGKIGAIVMNCNPFTFGHRYLIEQASEKMDQLIIFVVEENKSLFSFRERFAMVCEGTKDLKNVMVVPSGSFILTQQTFPEYFLKVENDDMRKNAEYDIMLFAEEIAPRLNIKYRFVGEEKDDPVTREYNDAMKRILLEHGIELLEIPRKIGLDGKAIRATNVRQLIENGDMDGIGEIVPETTRKILMMSWE